MSKRFEGDHPTVVVAVNADKHAENLVKIASSLCKRTGMRLRLVQVAEYWVGRSWPREITLEGPLAEAITVVENESMLVAQSHLRRLSEKVGGGIEVEVNVIAGYPADGIIADAVANHAVLIITGAAKGNHRFVPKGLSTALSLMSQAPVPVLVVQEGTEVDFEKSRFSMMVADDLSDHSEAAVLTAFDFATRIGQAKLEHIHVNCLTEENLKISLESATAASHLGMMRAFQGSEIYQMAMQTLEAKIRNRAPARKISFESAKGIYETKILTGDVASEIQKSVQVSNPDLLVFGRHRAFRRKPFLIGQVPFYAMLTHNKPVLVVPGEI